MRVALWVDMEGTSRITDHRECWPAFPQYWETGRAKLTADVVAAARGLLEGGATDVVIVNGHGLGWPNLLLEEMPDGARPLDDHAWSEGFDAMFQVGFHARAGTPDGFISHTMVPGFRVAVDGAPVTESHIWGWLVGAPVLGVVGDRALGAQLDGALRGTPFLAVKDSSSRAQTTMLHPNPEASGDAIRAFARDCTRAGWKEPPVLPSRLRVALSLDPVLAGEVVGQRGLTQVDPGVLIVDAEKWDRDVQPALERAIGAALRPLIEAQADLDLSSEASMRRQDPEGLRILRRFFAEWVGGTESA